MFKNEVGSPLHFLLQFRQLNPNLFQEERRIKNQERVGSAMRNSRP
jgi:hypothetical protein